jgi:hypothetical protein
MFIEILRVHLETRCETSSRVTMTEVQEAVRLPWVLAFGQLGGNVPDAIILDMFHKQLVTQNHTINVE